MEKTIVTIEAEMDLLEQEIQTLQQENLAVKKEIEQLLQSPQAISGSSSAIDIGLLAVQLLALKVLLTNLVKEEIACKNKLKHRTDQVLTTAYELHALLKRQLVTRRKQLAQAQAKLEQASSGSTSSAKEETVVVTKWERR